MTPAATAERLPYAALADAVAALLLDAQVKVPPRLVLPLPAVEAAPGSSLFVMPAHDARVAITKLITFTPANAGSARPAIQGDVVVFDIASGMRLALLDGPTVTARRTAAVSLLAARRLAAVPQGPLLLLGAGVQARAHLEALASGLGLREVVIVSRGAAAAQALADHARGLGLAARVAGDAEAELARCPLVVTCTPAREVVLRGRPRDDAFIAAVGAFTPAMVELDAALVRDIAQRGRIVVDTADAEHEAGDLLQAGVPVAGLPTLRDLVRGSASAPGTGPVLFKSCGWAGWDLAAARLATQGGR
jgi:ornithine cyclodeaminase